jgi:hypothetical protein
MDIGKVKKQASRTCVTEEPVTNIESQRVCSVWGFMCSKINITTNYVDTVIFPINQPTRRHNFSSLLLDVYLQLNMFRASSRQSSRAQQLQ